MASTNQTGATSETEEVVDVEVDDANSTVNENWFSDLEQFKEKLDKCKEHLKDFNVKKFSNKTSKSSKVWEHFGNLTYKGRSIFDKSVFCKMCLL